MATSQQLQSLNLEEFCFLYSQCVINQETEKVIKKVLEEQFLNKNKILLYILNHVSEIYYIPLMENIKKKLAVSSIYIQNKVLYIDWSL